MLYKLENKNYQVINLMLSEIVYVCNFNLELCLKKLIGVKSK